MNYNLYKINTITLYILINSSKIAIIIKKLFIYQIIIIIIKMQSFKRFSEDKEINYYNDQKETSFELKIEDSYNDLAQNLHKQYNEPTFNNLIKPTKAKLCFFRLNNNYSYASLYISCPNTDNENESTTNDEEYINTHHSIYSSMRKEMNKE